MAISPIRSVTAANAVSSVIGSKWPVGRCGDSVIIAGASARKTASSLVASARWATSWK